MTYLGMGLVFAAIAFVLVNIALSILTLAVWKLGRSRLRSPGALFALRMLPSVGALAAAVGLALPAYLSFEPLRSAERASAPLLAIVAIAVALIAAGLVRAAGSWLETRRVERSWRSVAEPRSFSGIEAYDVPTALPFAAVVGVVRPRLYVSGILMASLNEDERRALLAHEAGHRRSLDNLKRGLFRFAPDALASTRVAREIEAAWSTAAEESADDYASGGDPEGRLAVAGALLAASRLAPIRLARVSNFCDDHTIAHRVARLLDDRPDQATPRAAFRWLSLGGLVGAAALAGSAALPLAYAATETIIRRLQ
jgi:Zn-dependent protease with chaperone function